MKYGIDEFWKSGSFLLNIGFIFTLLISLIVFFQAEEVIKLLSPNISQGDIYNSILLLRILLVFIIFGATSTFLGQLLLQNSFELRIVAGVIIILFSLHIIGLINLKFLNYEKRIQTNNNKNIFSPIIIGVAFGFDSGC